MLSKFNIPFLLSNYILDKLEHFEALEEENSLEPLLSECVEILACLEEKDKFLFWFEKGISKKLLNSTKGNGTYWEEWFVKTVKNKVMTIGLALPVAWLGVHQELGDNRP